MPNAQWTMLKKECYAWPVTAQVIPDFSLCIEHWALSIVP